MERESGHEKLFSIPLMFGNEQKFIDLRAGADPETLALKSCVEFGGDVFATSPVDETDGESGDGSSNWLERMYTYCGLDLAAATPGGDSSSARCRPIQPSCVTTWQVIQMAMSWVEASPRTAAPTRPNR